MVGILDQRIIEMPIAVLDFETTGLTPGFDRVVEVSVVRIDPGQEPRLVLDTLVNPARPMAATEIHGITDEDVADAPLFRSIAGELVGVLSGCVVAAYNVYFDIGFLNFEFKNVGVEHEPPHFCLMYLRPMLGLGPRCRLEEACRLHGIEHEASHVAASDALASTKLLACYLKEVRERELATYGDLAGLKNYKFVRSFRNEPFPTPSAFSLERCDRLCSRTAHVCAAAVEQPRRPMAAYWDALRTVLVDLEITDEELEHINREKARLRLHGEQVRALHARAFSSAISQFTDDQWLDQREVTKLRRLHQCLAILGWAPGQ